MKYVVTAQSPEGMPIASFGSWIVDAESGEAAIGLVRHIKVYRDWWPTGSGWSAKPFRNGASKEAGQVRSRREIA
jgi:hypothetical protein